MKWSLYDDPSFYDRITSPPGGSLEFYLGVARASAGAVLELACGTGRLTIPIAQALVQDATRSVTGLDLAPVMLEAARSKARGRCVWPTRDERCALRRRARCALRSARCATASGCVGVSGPFRIRG